MTENFDWTQFSRKIAVKADMAKIYNAWTIPEELEKWFLKEANYFKDNGEKTEKQAPIKKGYTYEWSWYLYDNLEKGAVIEANGKDHIQFTFAGDCIVDIHLSKLDDLTIVKLTQKNIPTDEESKKNIRLGCDSGWAFYMVNLKSVYEGGLDLRNKEEKLKGMLNS